MLYSEYHRSVFLAIAVSFFLFLSSPFFSFSQTEIDAVFILKGNTKLASGKPAEGVDIEVKKNGQTVKKILSGKNGRYSLELEISILNKSSEYMIYISKEGIVPKTLSVNTYITPEEYRSNTFPRYQFDLPIILAESTEKEIVLEHASGKILWDNVQHAFAFDQTFAKVKQKDQDDPNKFLTDKKKKEEEEAARKKADEEARLKAEAEAKTLASQKLKDDAEKLRQKNLAMKAQMRKKHIQDSLDNLAAVGKTNSASPDDVDQNAFDGTGIYSINIARKSLKIAKEKMNREKAANLSAKYETNNTLTSLLNMVDESEKNTKSKAKSQNNEN